MKRGLLLVLALFGVYFTGRFILSLRRPGGPGAALPLRPSPLETLIGFGTVFFDTLGIGSFATTTTVFRATRVVPDELIPGTLNVGHTIAAVLSAFVFIELVPVSATTLVPMIAAAGVGAWIGAGIVAGLSRYRIRVGMGAALLGAVGIMLLTQLGLLPGGSDALGLTGGRLALAVAGNLVLGALMTLGIGLYAPCMILVSLLGLNPRTAFPIMMGSCAFLMCISGARFIREARYHASAALGLTLGGVPALFIAAYLVKALPITALRWLVIVVVCYTAITLLVAAYRERHPVPERVAAVSPAESG